METSMRVPLCGHIWNKSLLPLFSWLDTSPLHWSYQNKNQDRAKAIFWIIHTRVESMQNAWYEDKKIENPNSEREWMKLDHFYGCVALWLCDEVQREEEETLFFHEFAIVLKFAGVVPLQRNRICSSPSVWRKGLAPFTYTVKLWKIWGY